VAYDRPETSLHRPDEAAKYAERFWKYFEKVDEAIGKFVSDLGDETTVLVMSTTVSGRCSSS